MNKKCNGVTLIELVVVFAIIAVLSSIMTPVFVKSREKVKGTSCLSNCKELGTALTMYLQENNNVLPTIHMEAAAAAGDNVAELYASHASIGNEAQRQYVLNDTIYAQFQSYLKNSAVWKCPSDSGVPTTPAVGKRFTSYHYRHFIAASFNPGYKGCIHYWARPWSVNDFQNIAQSFIFCETIPFHDNRTVVRVDWRGDRQIAWAPDCSMNFIMGDGHAKTLGVEKAIIKADWAPGVGYDYHWPRGWGSDGFKPTADVID